jgi:predicted nucleotidyltransferase
MNKQAEEILAQLKEELRSRLSSNMVSVICFGSYARSEETPESDLDVLVVVKHKDKAIENLIREQVYEVMWNHDFQPLLSVKIISEEELKQRQRVKASFYEGLQEEGITV